jgi:LmbE family N-acetylglucosaminyl deacetylase
MKILVIAPHPDDETLGMGGTIHRLATEGHEITVAIVTRGWEPVFSAAGTDRVREEARSAASILGVAELRFMDLPVTRLDGLPKHEINAAFDELVDQTTPEWVFLPHAWDRHEDHRQSFAAAMVALRPQAGRKFVKRILSYETVSETHWTIPGAEVAFAPHLYVDISDHLETKLQAMACYESQIQPHPSARSLEALRALANWRGSVFAMVAAEAFQVLRERWDR